ncbi:MAG: LppX_LprAFG lipoprotein [Hamadaea sp.]|nr:LppX_LprAFG lipoprotein [Hamadaea sp.]
MLLAGITALAVAGCNADKGTATDSSSPSAAPSSSVPKTAAKDALAAAADKTNGTSYRLRVGMNGMMTVSGLGNVETMSKKYDMDMTVDMGSSKLTMQTVVVDTDMYIKIKGMPGLPSQWMKVSTSKIKPGSQLDPNTQNLVTMADWVVSAEWDGEYAVKGTLDMSKSPTATEQAKQQLGDKAKAVPFTATIDRNGYLTGMTLDMNAMMPGTGSMTASYSNFGEPVTVTVPPANQVTPMPAELIAAMGG